PIEEATMLNPTSLLADALGRNLAETYRRIYGDREPHIASGLDEAARLVIERIASSDAHYHDCEHTALVTLCVQDILRGRRLERTVSPIDWGHTILAALNHDIGYGAGDNHRADCIRALDVAVVVNLYTVQWPVDAEGGCDTVEQLTLRGTLRKAPAERLTRGCNYSVDQPFFVAALRYC